MPVIECIQCIIILLFHRPCLLTERPSWRAQEMKHFGFGTSSARWGPLRYLHTYPHFLISVWISVCNDWCMLSVIVIAAFLTYPLIWLFWFSHPPLGISISSEPLHQDPVVTTKTLYYEGVKRGRVFIIACIQSFVVQALCGPLLQSIHLSSLQRAPHMPLCNKPSCSRG